MCRSGAGGEATEGNVGAGAGASVGKLLGPDRAMRGGLGIATLEAHGITMAAVVVVNAVGDVVDPGTGAILAGARTGPRLPGPGRDRRTLLGGARDQGPAAGRTRRSGSSSPMRS